METYDLLKQTMRVADKRSQLISSNIANVNTPNYKAKRLAFESLLDKAASSQQLTTTNKKHIQINQNQIGKVYEKNGLSIDENGNNVNLELELLDQSANGLYYSALTAQLNGRLSMFNAVTST
ncbi:flagellar basal body rod protein FlgB [Enterococcus bulliens]